MASPFAPTGVSAAAATANARAALAVVERYRECKNTVAAFTAHLRALENMTMQKGALEGALRRQEGLSGGCVRVAAAPLGVLSAFTPAVTEQLLAQHEADQGQLMGTLGGLVQTWQQNTQTVAKLVAVLDEGGGGRAGPSPGAGKGAAAERKERLKQAAAALYAPASSGAPSPATAGGADWQRREELYVASTGLRSLAEVRSAAHALLSALTRMGSVMQECVLALRADLVITACDAQASASATRELLRREFTRSEPAAAVGGGASGLLSSSSAAACSDPLSFLDAVGELAAAVDGLWEVGCKEHLLNDFALVLLES